MYLCEKSFSFARIVWVALRLTQRTHVIAWTAHCVLEGPRSRGIFKTWVAVTCPQRTSMLWFEALIGQPAHGQPGERAERQTIRWTFESRRVQSTQKISTVFVAAAHRHQLHRRRTGYNGAFGLTPASLFCGHGWFTSLVNRLVACLQVFQSEKTNGACQKWLIT